ncbi:hypothetical protein M407DRAFT_148102 [Tulasnella calospora MUT 4182]|uniref:Uncharacterized protein n=1 Tax=Tulasnella calospora MUT 4182 TaxID=1051891 RepID=A0A0C3LD90_9AGAM|nr:hypothetical protein M407DRAFT_148102 [Tulasnella calospora MUT 4182]
MTTSMLWFSFCEARLLPKSSCEFHASMFFCNLPAFLLLCVLCLFCLFYLQCLLHHPSRLYPLRPPQLARQLVCSLFFSFLFLSPKPPN